VVTPSKSQGDKSARADPIARSALKEAKRESCESTNRKRIGGADDWGERANNREAPAAKESSGVDPTAAQ
jgi:hypothetical protein